MIFPFLTSVLVAALLIMVEVCFSFIFLLITWDPETTHNCHEKKKLQIQLCNKNCTSVSDVAKTKIHVHVGYVIKSPYGTVKIVLKEPVAFALKIETGGSSSYRMVVSFCQAICHIPHGSHLQSHCHQTLKSHLLMWIRHIRPSKIVS